MPQAILNPSPIFILGCHKSGTSLMRSLLDGHTDLKVIPFESHVMALMGKQVLYDYRKQEAMPQADFKANLLQLLRQYASSKDRTADAMLSDDMDVISAQQFIASANQPTDVKEAFQLIVDCLPHVFPQGEFTQEPSRLVEKSVEHHGFIDELYRAFPDAQFIHLIRNPYANVVGLRKFKAKIQGYPLFHRVMSSIQSSMDVAIDQGSSKNKNHHVIRHEDLVQRPEQTMQALAKAVNLSWDECLLSPSVMAEPWSGNSSHGQTKGIDASKVDAWQTQIHAFESWQVNRKLNQQRKAFNYPRFQLRGFALSKVQGEPWSRFVYNRLRSLIG